MRKILVVAAIAVLMACSPPLRCQDDSPDAFFSPEQLDNLLAPIALYPDPLLAQVLIAATFPEQIDEASRTLRGRSDPNSIDPEPWDVSVKAVARYPQVLDMMADKLDWTTSVGQAYVSQSTDVTESIQRLRAQARSAGNLISTREQEIRDDDGYIEIWPAQPQYLYVPMYDPAIVYYRRPSYFGGAVISFGRGFSIGVWLNHDFDWRGHRVFYHGWDHRAGWAVRSRPFIRMNSFYISNNFRTVHVDRTVIHRPVNYSNLNRYNAIHRGTNYGNVRGDRRGMDRDRGAFRDNRPMVNNKVIQRNIDTRDSRMDSFRGRDDHRPAVRQTPQRSDRSAFGGREGFDARREGHRGQDSRREMSRPARDSRPAPAAKSAPASQPRTSEPQRGERDRRRR